VKRTVANALADPPAEPAARWEDYVDVFISPAALFRRRADDRATHPVLTLIGASVALYIVMLPANRRLLAQGASNPQAAAFLEQWGGLFQVLGGLLVPVNVLLTVGFAAILLRGAAGMFDIPANLRQTFLIATYAGFIVLLSQISSGVLALLRGGSIDPVRDLSFGVLRFLGDAAPADARAWLGRLDLFAIWQAAVWAIGMHVVAGATRGRALASAAAAWLLFAVPGWLIGLVTPTPPVPGAGA
jgi:hypothetical protein